MPIKIPNTLPGRQILEKERVSIIDESDALRQDIRPLQIAILNLMPDKIKTETQLLRVLGATPLQIEITLLHMNTHESKNTSKDHLLEFYVTHDDIKDRKFDGLIVTGAPVEQMEFEDVTYWNELKEIINWAETNVHSSFFICWGAQAALHHYHGLPKHMLAAKQSGVYPHKVTAPFEPLITGFDDILHVPVSRHTELRHADIEAIKDLRILVDSDESGACLVHEPASRRIYMFNHLEYDVETLKGEYDRDKAAGLSPAVPAYYFPCNDPSQSPSINWRAHRTLLFGNWINMVYQSTPYDLEKIKK